MTSKTISIIGYVGFIFYGIVTAITGYETYLEYSMFGLYHEQWGTQKIVSDFYTNISATLLFFATAMIILLLLRKEKPINRHISIDSVGEYGITFPKGKPTYWDVSVAREARQLEISINSTTITVNKDTIDSLFKGEVKRN